MPSYVVTGASRGIGYGFITHLASIPGNTVVGLVRDKAAVEARLAKDNISNVHLFVADVTDANALEAAASVTAQITGGGLDILINNAGLVPKDLKDLPDFTHEELADGLTKTFSANVVGVAHTINAFLPLIRGGKEKKVITISTGFADMDITKNFGFANAGPYSISKVAANALMTKYDAALGESEGILFLSLAPGFVDTSEGQVPSEPELARMQTMAGKFAAYAPDFKGPITVEESVRLQMDVIRKATVETMGGAFVSQHGDKQWL